MEMKSLDIFCEIIDNYGDIGVVYRLAKEMKKLYKDKIEIRVILNRLDEFKKLNKRVEDIQCQEIDGIIYITEEFLTKNICTFSPANVIIEAFGCNVFQGYMEKAKEESSLLLNLEYLSGEKWIEDIHGMESLMGAKKLKKFFFMPGFSKKSGGVMVDSLFLERKHKVLKNKTEYKEKYFGNYYKENMLVGSIFSYEKNFHPLIEALLKNKRENMLLIMGEKTKESFQNLFKNIEVQKVSEDEYVYENIYMKFMPFLEQEEYEEVINIVDYNFVRGEDSFIRALLTGKPFVWHIYLQEELAHMDKINGFIDRYKETINNNDDGLNVHLKLLKDYNMRESNSYELGNEKFEDFFQYFNEIKRCTEEYSDYIISHCNLIDKLNRFILKY